MPVRDGAAAPFAARGRGIDEHGPALWTCFIQKDQLRDI